MRGTKAHLMSWGTGRVPGNGFAATQNGAETVVVEDAQHLPAVLESDLVGADTTVFVPGESSDSDRPNTVRYEGSLREPGLEFSLGSAFYLQIQSYGISEYMSVVGPTLIRISDDADFEAYLHDADRARQEGEFAQFLTNPVTQLADLPGLGAGVDRDGPDLRLNVGPAGELSTSPGGRRLGALGDGLAELRTEWASINAASAQPCAVCLGGTLDENARSAELADRPWLGRYLAALDAIRNVRSRGLLEPKVSGFGDRLDPALRSYQDARDLTDAAAPLLLWTDETAFVYDIGTGRIFQMDRVTARVTELLLVHGTVEAAAEHAPLELLTRATQMFTQAGVRFGDRTVLAGAN